MQGKVEGISICVPVDTFIFRAIDGDKEIDSNCNGIHVSKFHYMHVPDLLQFHNHLLVTFYSFLPSSNFCCLLITFANSLYPDL